MEVTKQPRAFVQGEVTVQPTVMEAWCLLV